MANITVSANTTVVNANATTNNVSVSSTQSNIVVGETTFVANSIVRAALSVNDTGGDGSLSYSNTTGVFTYTGPDQTEANARIAAAPTQVRQHLGNTLPITYDSVTGVIGFDQNLDDLTLKKYQETVVDNGTLSGNISVNITDGTVHQAVLGGNITGITLGNISTGGSATLFLDQDGIGGAVIDTTTHASNWTNWKFTNGYTDLSTGANEWSALNVFYDGTDYYATLITETGALVQNSDLANSNVTFNGVTVDLGSSGEITDFTSNVLISANANITQALTVGTDITSATVETTGNATVGGDLKLAGGVIDATGATTVEIKGQSGNIIANTSQVTIGDPLYTTGVLTPSNVVSPGTMSIRGGESVNLGDTTDFLKLESNVFSGGVQAIRQYAGFNATGNANIYIDPHGTQTSSGGFRILSNANADLFYVDTNGTTRTTTLITSGNIQANDRVVTNHITPLSDGNVEVSGNLNVQGNLNYVNVVDLLVDDQSITLNYGNIAQDAFIYVDRTGASGTNTAIKWNETTDKWQFTNDGSTYYPLPESTSDLAEGTNLYYTTDRANSAISAYTGSIENLTGNVTTTANINSAGGTLTGILTSDSNITTTANINSAGGTLTGVLTSNSNIELTNDNLFVGDINGAVQQEVRNVTGAQLDRGKAVYLTGANTGDTPHVALADNSNAQLMPVIGIVKNNIPDTNTGEIVTSGELNIGTHGFALGSDLFVNGTGDLQETAPTGEGNLIQKIGKVVNNTHIIVQGAFRTNATPNLDDGNIFLGNATNQTATAVFTDEANTAIGAYTGDMLNVDDIVANTVTTSNAITSQSYVYIEQQSNTATGGIRSFNGNSSLVNFFTAQPALNVENGFLAIQASDETANVFSIPRYAMGKLPDAPTITNSSVDEYGVLGGTFDSETYAMPGGVESGTGVMLSTVNKRRGYAIPNFGITYTAGGATPHATGTIEYGVDDSNVYVRAAQSFGTLAGQPGFFAAYVANGTIKFRTVQTDILASLPSIAPYNEATNFANSTVAYMDSKFHIGREDDGTSYSFPKTAGNNRDYLRLDANNELEFANSFAGLLNDQGTVIGSVTFDMNNGNIHKIETAGDITDLVVSNKVVGTQITIIVKQGSTTGALTGSTNWLWAGGSKTLSTNTGDVDVIKAVWDGTNYHAELTKGYVA